jgi:LuxR family quorum-sensing system transcriptional regulator CciR
MTGGLLTDGHGHLRQLSSLHDAEAFIDALRKAPSQDALALMLEQIGGDMGFSHYALVHHVDHSVVDGTMLRLENYPENWVGSFLEKKLYSWDPVYLACQTSSAAFAWTDVPDLIRLNQAQRDVLKTAAAEGLGDGFTVPVHMPGQADGSCTFVVRTGRALPRQHLGMVQLVGAFAFQAARALNLLDAPPRVELTSRQLDCILLVGRGKSDWEIAQILGIKEDTVTEYLNAARARYGVARRIQLVMRAVHDGHIALSDLIG